MSYKRNVDVKVSVNLNENRGFFVDSVPAKRYMPTSCRWHENHQVPFVLYSNN